MELPSWVPEWNVKTNKTYQVNTSYEACGKFRIADLVPTSSLNILGVRGFCVDTIVDLGEMPRIDRLHFPDGPRKIMGFFDSVQRLINISKKTNVPKQSMELPVITTLRYGEPPLAISTSRLELAAYPRKGQTRNWNRSIANSSHTTRTLRAGKVIGWTLWQHTTLEISRPN